MASLSFSTAECPKCYCDFSTSTHYIFGEKKEGSFYAASLSVLISFLFLVFTSLIVSLSLFLVHAGTNERRYLNYIEAFITRNCSGIVSLFYTVCASRHRRQRLVSSSVRFRRISYSSSDRVLELGFGFPLKRIRNCPGLMGVWCASYLASLLAKSNCSVTELPFLCVSLFHPLFVSSVFFHSYLPESKWLRQDESDCQNSDVALDINGT